MGFLGKKVQVKGYITLKTTFGAKENTKQIKVMYLIIHLSSSYNMIMWRPTFNQLGFVISTLYMCMKYMLPYELVRVIQGDQEIARKCYVESLKLKKVKIMGLNTVGIKFEASQ